MGVKSPLTGRCIGDILEHEEETNQKMSMQVLPRTRSVGGSFQMRSNDLAQARYRVRHPERCVFANMVQRCRNPKIENYKRYGAKGIKVLYKSYQDFIADVGTRPTRKHQIDRIDSRGNYIKGNCRWVTSSEQNANRRCNILVDGKCLKQFCRENDINYKYAHMCFRLCETGRKRIR